MGKVLLGEYMLEKSLFSEYPDLASEWDYDRNEKLTPQTIAPHSNKKVFWICSNGHSYECTPDKRVGRGQGCPYCSGKKVLAGFNDIATVCPELLVDWDYEHNTDFTPSDLTIGSHKKVNWKCHVCGFAWKISMNDRKQGRRGCPNCAKKQRVKSYRATRLINENNPLVEQHPVLLEEWDYKKNVGIRPDEFSSNSSEKVWWVCKTCGNSWKAAISNRTNRDSGCPKCKRNTRTSFPEQALYFYIRQIYGDAENGCREVFSDYRPGRGMIELDIYIPSLKVGIEYDGIAWHKNSKQLDKGKTKYQLCRQREIKLIRISEFQVNKDNYCDELYLRTNTADELELETIIEKVIERLGADCKEGFVNIERDRAAIMSQFIVMLHDKSIAAKYPNDVKYWDYEKNKGIKPEMVNATSNKNYWWKCSKGHSFKCSPSNKFSSNGEACPFCTNHKVLAGFNDLATRYPSLALEWDEEKNGNISPDSVMPGSQKKYWWKCSLGHSYLMSPNSKVYSKNGCPVCNGNQVLEGYNDLKSQYPQVVEWWDYEKNTRILPNATYYGCNKIVWWKCDKGHSFKKSIRLMVRKITCPVCDGRILVTGENDLFTKFPDIVKDWNYEKNTIKPEDVKPSSAIKVWWKCHSCGNEWQAFVNNRVNNDSGCPVCGYAIKMKETLARKRQNSKHTLLDVYPEIAKDWDFEKNGELRPEDVAPHSNLKVWWKCSNGHSYNTQVDGRTGKRKTGCPYCSGKRRLHNLTVTNPNLCLEWDYVKNDSKPEEHGKNDKDKIWWICKNKHSYQASITARANRGKTGCPYCSNKKVLVGYNDLTTRFPDIASEWDYAKNEKLKPEDVVYGSAKKIWWICSKCKHSWLATVVARTTGHGCPNCKAMRNRKAIICLETGEVYDSMTSAVEHGYSASSLRACLQGKTETYRGFHWRYVEDI